MTYVTFVFPSLVMVMAEVGVTRPKLWRSGPPVASSAPCHSPSRAAGGGGGGEGEQATECRDSDERRTSGHRGPLQEGAFSAWNESDCEMPLHLYRQYGFDFAAHLRGMYAIALHDPSAGQLILARDPFGIKPLYYAETPRGFAFASEPGALIEAGIVAPQLVRSARNELLQMQFTTGRETIFAGINRVLPGEMVVVRRGRIVERRRCAALPEGGPLQFGEAEAIARLDAALLESVRLHQRSDVPFGVFLSGGIDSTGVLMMMARLAERLRSGPSMSSSCLMKPISGSCCPKSFRRSTTRPPIMQSCRPGLLLARRMKPASK